MQRQDSGEEDRHVRWDLSSCLAKPDHLHHSDSQTSGIFSQVEKNISCVKKIKNILTNDAARLSCRKTDINPESVRSEPRLLDSRRVLTDPSAPPASAGTPRPSRGRGGRRRRAGRGWAGPRPETALPGGGDQQGGAEDSAGLAPEQPTLRRVRRPTAGGQN